MALPFGSKRFRAYEIEFGASGRPYRDSYSQPVSVHSLIVGSDASTLSKVLISTIIFLYQRLTDGRAPGVRRNYEFGSFLPIASGIDTHDLDYRWLAGGHHLPFKAFQSSRAS